MSASEEKPRPLSRWQSFSAIFQGVLSGVGGVAIFMAALYFFATSRAAEVAGIFVLGGFTVMMLVFCWLAVKAAVEEARKRKYLAVIGIVAFFSTIFVSAYASVKIWPMLYSYYFGGK